MDEEQNNEQNLVEKTRKEVYLKDHSVAVDYLIKDLVDMHIVSSLNDNYNFNRIARYVSVTLQGNATPVVILTKEKTYHLSPHRYHTFQAPACPVCQ